MRTCAELRDRVRGICGNSINRKTYYNLKGKAITISIRNYNYVITFIGPYYMDCNAKNNALFNFDRMCVNPILYHRIRI